MSRRFLIVYATSYGQTAKIAGRMADLLMASGEAVTLVNAFMNLRSNVKKRGQIERSCNLSK